MDYFFSGLSSSSSSSLSPPFRSLPSFSFFHLFFPKKRLVKWKWKSGTPFFTPLSDSYRYCYSFSLLTLIRNLFLLDHVSYITSCNFLRICMYTLFLILTITFHYWSLLTQINVKHYPRFCMYMFFIYLF